MYVEAVHPFDGDTLEDQLTFDAGALIFVPDPARVNLNGGWTYGECVCRYCESKAPLLSSPSLSPPPDRRHYRRRHHHQRKGWFPASYVRQVEERHARKKLGRFSLTRNATK